jgi:Zn-dependent protease
MPREEAPAEDERCEQQPEEQRRGARLPFASITVGGPAHRGANLEKVDEAEPERASAQQAVEGTYLPPDEPQRKANRWRNAGGLAVGLAVLLAKFKALFFALLNLKWLFFGGKFLISGLSFLASIWFYALFFGWKFGIVFVLLIAVHEAGHIVFMRAVGLPASLPYFIPGLGAFTALRAPLPSIFQESIVAFGGPLLGTLGGIACFAYGYATGNAFWYAAAYTAFFLNLFNMFPVAFLDGGRMTGAISPSLWTFGLVLLVVLAIAFHWWSPLLLILVLFGVPRALAAWRGKLDPNYYNIPAAQRVTISLAYFGLIAVLLVLLLASRVAVPGQGMV